MGPRGSVVVLVIRLLHHYEYFIFLKRITAKKNWSRHYPHALNFIRSRKFCLGILVEC